MTPLNRTECAAMRGLAILGIVLHNYCHWLYPAVKENEYTFTQANVDGLVHAISSPTSDLPIHLLSFFGHYGVPVFLFLSAYGLTMKYERGGADESVRYFLWKHFKKLWMMMFIGFAVFLMADRVIGGPHKYHFIDIVGQLGLFNNLLPNPDGVIWPGPFWFFGLMLQFYIVYRLFIYRRHWGITVALMLVCMGVQYFCEPTSELLNRLRYNFIGGMLPFGLGILYARFSRANHRQWLYAVLTLISMVLIFGWSLEYKSWFLVPAAVCVFAVSLAKVTPAVINNWFAWVGGISSAMFVFHPIARKLFIMVARRGDIYTGLLMYVIATIALAMMLKPLLTTRKASNPSKK